MVDIGKVKILSDSLWSLILTLLLGDSGFGSTENWTLPAFSPNANSITFKFLYSFCKSFILIADEEIGSTAYTLPFGPTAAQNFFE